MAASSQGRQRGQILPLFAITLTAIVLGVAVIVDGGFAFAQRRVAQNAADFAAMAGTRILGMALTQSPPGVGTPQNVEDTIQAALTANGASLVEAQYVDEAGVSLGEVVGATSIPSGAFGIVVGAKTDWSPYLLGVIGVSDWVAGAKATAKTPGENIGGGVVPVGIQNSHYGKLAACDPDEIDECFAEPATGDTDRLTSGNLNKPGQFGWLSFGLQGNGGKCDWEWSLGMVAGGCDQDKPFLDFELGPPAQSYECCTAVGVEGPDLISGLTGNEWGDLSGYVHEPFVVWAPIWDEVKDNGANAAYHIVGFGAIMFTGEDAQHGKWLTGKRVTGQCRENEEADTGEYCLAPGDDFIVNVTGEVQLVR